MTMEAAPKKGPRRKVSRWYTTPKDGRAVVTIFCPDCGAEVELDHGVDLKGNVDPNVECPADGCGLDARVRLARWEELCPGIQVTSS